MNFFEARRLFFISGLLSVLLPLFLSAAVAAVPPPLIASSVKIRVDAANGHSWGTGTIIDTRQWEALILTCGHIFGESQGKGKIEVHLFGENAIIPVLGTCQHYDLEIDLALVSVPVPFPVRAIPIAPNGYQIQPSQQAWSVGCDHGGNPTVRTHQIMSVDKVGTPREKRVPFHYVQVSGAPVSGRSGGGLFSAEGYLIGVCNTGDPAVNDGHFVPPQIIRYVLDKRNLSEVYTNPSLGEPTRQTPPTALAALTPLSPLAPIESLPSTPIPNTLGALPVAAAALPAPMYAENKGMNSEEQATLEEIRRGKQNDSEVIVIIRSRTNPEIPSDVIVLNGASDQFLGALVNSSAPPAAPAYNPVIFSSHEAPTRTVDRQAQQNQRAEHSVAQYF